MYCMVIQARIENKLHSLRDDEKAKSQNHRIGWRRMLIVRPDFDRIKKSSCTLVISASENHFLKWVDIHPHTFRYAFSKQNYFDAPWCIRKIGSQTQELMYSTAPKLSGRCCFSPGWCHEAKKALVCTLSKSLPDENRILHQNIFNKGPSAALGRNSHVPCKNSYVWHMMWCEHEFDSER